MLLIALVIGLILILSRALKLLRTRYTWAKKISSKIDDIVYYNVFIRYVIQSTLKVQIAAIATIKLVDWSSTSGMTQGIISIVIVAFLT